MVGAIVTHVRLREPLGKSVPAIVLLLLAIFVAYAASAVIYYRMLASAAIRSG